VNVAELTLPLSVPCENAANQRNLWQMFVANRGRILITYALFNLENLVRLAQPFVLGWAISDLLHGSCEGLLIFVAQHLAHMLLGAGRRMYDTRAFTAIYTTLAADLVHEQRQNGVETSTVAARSSLARTLVDFFEHDVPNLLFAVYSLVGSLVILLCYDGVIALLCLALLIPLGLINVYYSRRSMFLTGCLNDQLEREVGVIGRASKQELHAHFSLLSRWRIKLSDSEAFNFSLMEIFILGLLAAVLMRSCQMTGSDAGSIFAVFRYVLMFAMGLDSVPVLVQQISRLRDISVRVQNPTMA
jgi:ABC-type multidrug transport system fused ATPase/permease subunit